MLTIRQGGLILNRRNLINSLSSNIRLRPKQHLRQLRFKRLKQHLSSSTSNQRPNLHLHLKVRAAGHPELTTQVYFPDAIGATVLDEPEYGGAPQTDNEDDNFYTGDTLMDVTGDNENGYSAVAVVVVRS